MNPPDERKLPPAVKKLLPDLDAGRGFYEPDEIRRAKRSLPIKRLLRVLGDEAYLLKRPGLNPFPGTEAGATFELEQIDGRWTWRCPGCGSRRDQIDYVERRFNLPTGKAIKLLCRVAGIR